MLEARGRTLVICLVCFALRPGDRGRVMFTFSPSFSLQNDRDLNPRIGYSTGQSIRLHSCLHDPARIFLQDDLYWDHNNRQNLEQWDLRKASRCRNKSTAEPPCFSIRPRRSDSRRNGKPDVRPMRYAIRYRGFYISRPSVEIGLRKGTTKIPSMAT